MYFCPTAYIDHVIYSVRTIFCKTGNACFAVGINMDYFRYSFNQLVFMYAATWVLKLQT
jgi:hypothetical protein